MDIGGVWNATCKGGIDMLSKEECLEALTEIKMYGSINIPLYSLEVIENLIGEHFDNPPLKFEELKEGMWIWDNYWEEYFEISEVYSNTKEIDVLIHQNKINQRRYETIKYTPNRFYRKEVQE